MSAIPGAFAQLNCPCCFRPGNPLCESPSERLTPAQKLSALRGLMLRHKFDAYLVPSEDSHGSEYVSDCDMRRSWISGFSGSAGTALITHDHAYLWTDGRYFLQAEKQLSSEWQLMKAMEPGVPEINDFIATFPEGLRVGVDPSLFPYAKAKEWNDGWEKKNAGIAPCLVGFEMNLIDTMWPTRPQVPRNSLKLHPMSLSGEGVSEKLKRVRDSLIKDSADAIVVSALDQIAWLFNLRGSDIICNPVFFSYAIVTLNSAHLFVGRVATSLTGEDTYSDILQDDISSMLSEAEVSLHSYGTLSQQMKSVLSNQTQEAGEGKRSKINAMRVMVENSSSMQIADLVTMNGAELVPVSTSPIQLFKACKNQVEIQGLKLACVRDSAAVVSFLAWLKAQVHAGEKGPNMKEHALGLKMSSFREKMGKYMGDSFETISAVDGNGSIIHYKPEVGGGALLSEGCMYLLDTGGQYSDGTTDVTRTMHFGTPTEEQIRCYTRVLQGHMNLARAVFPEGTCGLALDTLAREPLWRDGMTYAHGTGHGMGAYLNVHEGPMGIGGNACKGNFVRKSSRMMGYYLEPIEAGMFLSNEPGYYKGGEFGIRIESDMIAKPIQTKFQSGNRPFLQFETLTKVPMCRELIDVNLLSKDDVEWLNAFHKDCFDSLSPLICQDKLAMEWLTFNTASL